MKFSRNVILWSALIVLRVSHAGESSPVPESAKWIIHLEWQRVISSSAGPLVKQIAERPEGAKALSDIRSVFDVNLVDDIQNVSIFGSDANEQNAVLAITGKFNAEKLLGLARAAEQHSEREYAHRTIHQWQDRKRNRPTLGCLAGGNLLLVGSSDTALQQSIDALDSSPSGAVGAKLNTPDVLIYCAVRDLGDLRGAKPNAEILRQLKELHLSLSATKDNQFSLLAETEASDNASAQNVKSVADGLRALAVLNKEKDANGAALAEKIQIQQNGKVVQLSLSIPAETATAWLQDRLNEKRPESRAQQQAPAPIPANPAEQK